MNRRFPNTGVVKNFSWAAKPMAQFDPILKQHRGKVRMPGRRQNKLSFIHDID